MPDAHPLRSGDPEHLGAYEVLGRLGEGGQGAVFLARGAGEYVAIKLLHAGLNADDTARARFVRELEVAKRVARFCTAAVIDADVAGDQPYIVSEYVPGLSLHKLVAAEGPRSGGALERLAISTLTALTAIHQAGIVHRDFKPHNVMLGPDGPRVIDFGVARAYAAAGETQNVGTPAYMAPEHFTGGNVGPAADMFAWGTTMAYAANGRPAFGNDEMAAVMHRILTGEPDLGDLPSPLRDVVVACLSKDPDQRPSAREAQEMLVGAASGAMPAAGAAGAGAAAAAPAAFPTERTDPGEAPRGNTSPQPPPYDSLNPPVAAAAEGPSGSGGPAGTSWPGGPGGMAETSWPGGPGGQGGPAGASWPGGPGGPGAAMPSPAPHPPEKKGRKRLAPLVAAAAVLVVAAGGAAWAATRSGDDGNKNDQKAAIADQNTQNGQDGQAGNPAGAGGQSKGPKNPKAPGNGQGQQGNGSGGDDQTGGNDPKGGGGKSKPGTKPSKGGGGGGGGGSTQEPANKFTPQSACDSGGHGGGYYVQRSLSVSGGTAYLLYNSSGYNCAVTMKTKSVGTSSGVSVFIQKQGGSPVADSGSFSWYAGPVYVSAKKTCVRFGGNGASAPYGNCG
ncbi:serine/threonine protein kinase [Actinomadura barringtoniae]|uniref:Serine/threonine protein kinase n=2 Tax=Actinomadura barringtoniae TaxID=1427535 RepID=A0A939P7L7_9ACTN|nr:serine/threonine protein kinase [Actinomadura barringtoniae]